MPEIDVGEWVSIRWRGNTARDVGFLPREAAGRMCVVDSYDESGTHVTLWFPYPIKMRNGTLQDKLTIKVQYPLYGLVRETILPSKWDDGPTKDTVMVPVQMLYDNYWTRFGAKDPAWEYKNSSMDLQAEIEAEGLRAPVILGRDFGLRHGSHRVLIYRRLGIEFIEAYVTDHESGRVKVRVRPEVEEGKGKERTPRVNNNLQYHGCKGRLR